MATPVQVVSVWVLATRGPTVPRMKSSMGA